MSKFRPGADKPLIHIHMMGEITPENAPKLSDVLKIEHGSFEPRSQFPPQALWDILEPEREPKGFCIVAELAEDHGDKKKGSIVGFMIYENISNGVHLMDLAVDPNCRSWGIAKHMMNDLINSLGTIDKNFIQIELKVDSPLQSFFSEKFGFRKIGTLHNHYGKGEHALAMRRLREPENPVRKYANSAPLKEPAHSESHDIEAPLEMRTQNALEQREARNVSLRFKKDALKLITNCEWEIVQAADDGTYQPLAKPLEDIPYDANAEFHLQTAQQVRTPAERYDSLMHLVGNKNYYTVPTQLSSAKSGEAVKITVKASDISNRKLEGALESEPIDDYSKPRPPEKGDDQRLGR